MPELLFAAAVSTFWLSLSSALKPRRDMWASQRVNYFAGKGTL